MIFSLGASMNIKEKKKKDRNKTGIAKCTYESL